MHFLVVGPGAMGCLFAAGLKRAGFKVTLLDYLPQRAQQIKNQGIEVQGVTGDYTVKVPAVANSISKNKRSRSAQDILRIRTNRK